MSQRLFVGSLAWATDDDGLKAAFEKVGEVESARVIRDRDTNRSRGFGFVEMKEAADGVKAVEQLNGSDLDGRKITVGEARARD